MNNPNYIQLLIILAVVGFSVVSWIFRKLQEQSQLRRIQTERQRQELEMLRTGRVLEGDVPPVATGADSDRLRDLAARRQAQLQELRRRAQERMRMDREAAARSGDADRPVVFIPGSAGPIVVERTRTPRPPAPQPPRQVPLGRTPVPVRRPGQPAQPPAQTRQTRMGPQQPERRRAQGQPQRDQSRRRTEPAARPIEPDTFTPPKPAERTPIVPAAPRATAAAPRPGAVVIAGGPLTAADWRRAFIAKEILSAPVALRDEGASDRHF